MADGDPATEPRWLRTLVAGAALALVSFGGIGLVLADVGFYRWWLVLLLAVPVFLVLLALITPVLRVGGVVPDRELTLTARGSPSRSRRSACSGTVSTHRSTHRSTATVAYISTRGSGSPRTGR
jgi:hypothetical protein